MQQDFASAAFFCQFHFGEKDPCGDIKFIGSSWCYWARVIFRRICVLIL